MNNDLIDQIPADEQPTASKLYSAAETMKVPPDFQWKLETQLTEAYKTRTQPAPISVERSRVLWDGHCWPSAAYYC